MSLESVVDLNVGGLLYTTSIGTLTKVESGSNTIRYFNRKWRILSGLKQTVEQLHGGPLNVTSLEVLYGNLNLYGNLKKVNFCYLVT